jgi:hypothetical protein
MGYPTKTEDVKGRKSERRRKRRKLQAMIKNVAQFVLKSQTEMSKKW